MAAGWSRRVDSRAALAQGSPVDSRTALSPGKRLAESCRIACMTSDDTSPPVDRRRTMLVAADGDADVRLVVATLAEIGFVPEWAFGFADAKAKLVAASPDLLLADIRLAEYNGLHLVLRGKAVDPNLAALVLSPTDDVVLRREAEGLGATFIVRPIAARELLAAARRTLYRTSSADQIRPPFERRITERRIAAARVALERRTTERRHRGVGALITDGSSVPPRVPAAGTDPAGRTGSKPI